MTFCIPVTDLAWFKESCRESSIQYLTSSTGWCQLSYWRCPLQVPSASLMIIQLFQRQFLEEVKPPSQTGNVFVLSMSKWLSGCEIITGVLMEVTLTAQSGNLFVFSMSMWVLGCEILACQRYGVLVVSKIYVMSEICLVFFTHCFILFVSEGQCQDSSLLSRGTSVDLWVLILQLATALSETVLNILPHKTSQMDRRNTIGRFWL